MNTIETQASSSPPIAKNTPQAWLKKNLFNTWYNSIISFVLLALISWGIYGFFRWATTVAEWEVIKVNLPLFMVGRYPKDQYWRIWLIFGIISSLGGLSWGVIARKAAKLFTLPVLVILGVISVIALLIPVALTPPFIPPNPPLEGGLKGRFAVYFMGAGGDFPLLILMVGLVVGNAWLGKQLGNKITTLGRWLSAAWFIAFLLILWLMLGGLGIKSVSTNDWGGLILTILMAVVSIFLSFPLGLLLALGRQSTLPVIKFLSIGYIEIIRGLPLISILFMGQIMIPLFLPDGMRPDRVLRAILGLTLFSAAYLAENVRGGLQSVPTGQTEAAKALGLNTGLVLTLIVLPQALKVAIPAIVGQFISLFQDTTLLAIVGLVELLGISRSILAQPQFLGDYAEVYLFDGILFWLICYSMSLGSRQLEKKLNTTHK